MLAAAAPSPSHPLAAGACMCILARCTPNIAPVPGAAKQALLQQFAWEPSPCSAYISWVHAPCTATLTPHTPTHHTPLQATLSSKAYMRGEKFDPENFSFASATSAAAAGASTSTSAGNPHRCGGCRGEGWAVPGQVGGMLCTGRAPHRRHCPLLLLPTMQQASTIPHALSSLPPTNPCPHALPPTPPHTHQQGGAHHGGPRPLLRAHARRLWRLPQLPGGAPHLPARGGALWQPARPAQPAAAAAHHLHIHAGAFRLVHVCTPGTACP